MTSSRKEVAIDKALERFDSFASELSGRLNGHFSEADTRVKFIDPLLTTVLGWEELSHIRREQNHVDDEQRHCIDYVLGLNGPLLVVEAKKLLRQFEIPSKSQNLYYSLNGVITQWPNAWAAILQARNYCDLIGARYALITNGRQYIAFRAITDGEPWTAGRAVVFRSLEAIREHFVLFYECLSRDYCAKGRLSEVSREAELEVYRKKPRASVTCATSGFRNTLHDVLYKAFREVFLDNADPDTDFLRECYCTTADVLKYGRQLDSLLVDPMPEFKAPIHPVRPGDKSDRFAETIKRLGQSPHDPLVIVMGGAGVGKTTFLQWYFRASLDRKARSKTVVVTCDYRSIECEPSELHRRTLIELVRGLNHEASDLVSSFEQLRGVFREPIARAIKGVLKPFSGDKVELDKRIAALIGELQTQDEEHLRHIVTFLRAQCGRQVTFILDNIDQKRDLFQEKLYHTAQAIAHSSGALVILSLREATYQRLMRRPEFNAFTSIDFHVKAQPLSTILEKRLAFLSRRFAGSQVSIRSSSGNLLTIQDLEKFLRLITRSLLPQGEESSSTECLAAISNGNARLQLQLIYTFLVSGQTKIDDYFWSYSKSETGDVPFHEFLHSIILGDRRVFEEGSGSEFLNLFEPCTSVAASHFTSLRILEYFKTGLGQTGLLRNTDFVPLETICVEFAAQGLTGQDIAFHVRRMAEFGLLMPQGSEASHGFMEEPFALTKCGLYYLEGLYRNATYFSLMLHDTTMFDQQVCESIGRDLARHSTLPKLPLYARIDMAKKFLDYLETAESRELNDGAAGRHSVFGGRKFVGSMRRALEDVSRVRA